MLRRRTIQSGRRSGGWILPERLRAWVLLAAMAFMVLLQGFGQAVHERTGHHGVVRSVEHDGACGDEGLAGAGHASEHEQGPVKREHGGRGDGEHRGCATCVMLAIAARTGGTPACPEAMVVMAAVERVEACAERATPARPREAVRSRGPPACA